MSSTALAVTDLLGDVGEMRASKYVDAGCSMPVVSFLSFVLITGVTVVNVIQNVNNNLNDDNNNRRNNNNNNNNLNQNTNKRSFAGEPWWAWARTHWMPAFDVKPLLQTKRRRSRQQIS